MQSSGVEVLHASPTKAFSQCNCKMQAPAQVGCCRKHQQYYNLLQQNLGWFHNLACSILMQQMLESVLTATAGLPRHLEGSPQRPPCTLFEALSYCAHEPPTQQSTIIFRRPHSSHNNLDCMSSITGPCHNCLATASAQSVQHVKAQMSCKTGSCFCSMMPNSLYACPCTVNLCTACTATSSKGASCVYTTNTCSHLLAHGVGTTGSF